LSSTSSTKVASDLEPTIPAARTKRSNKEAPAWFQEYAAKQEALAEKQRKHDEEQAAVLNRLLEAQLKETKERNSILKLLTDALLKK